MRRLKRPERLKDIKRKGDKKMWQSVTQHGKTKYYKGTKRIFLFPKIRFEKGYKKQYRR